MSTPSSGNTGQNPKPTPSKSNEAASTVQSLENLDEFQKILTNAGNKYLLIEFYAEWCGPCRMIAGKLDIWAKTYDVMILKIDVDNFEELAIEYDVNSMPTFVIIKEKQKLQSFEGSNTDNIENYLQKFCMKGGERTSIHGATTLNKPRSSLPKRATLISSTQKPAN